MSSRVYFLNPPFLEGYTRDACWQAVGRAKTFKYPVWLTYGASKISRLSEIYLLDAIAKKWDVEKCLSSIRDYNPDMVVCNVNWSSLENDMKICDIIEKEFKVFRYGIPTGKCDEELFVALNDDRFVSKTPMFVSQIYKKFLKIEDYYLTECFHPTVQILAHGVSCPYHCTFCNRIHRNSKISNPKKSVDEVEWIKNNLPQTKEIHYEDDNFCVNKEWVESFCKDMIRRKLDFVWSCQVRADVSYEVLKLMKDAGCRLIIVGFESGSDKILKKIRKGINVEDAKKFVKNVKKVGILLQGDFIIGLPEEDFCTIQLTRNLVKEISPEILQVTIATPYPKTEFYDWVVDNDYLIKDNYLNEEGLLQCVINYPNLSTKEIEDSAWETLVGYYKSWSFWKTVPRQVFRRNGFEEMKRLIRSARKFRLEW